MTGFVQMGHISGVRETYLPFRKGFSCLTSNNAVMSLFTEARGKVP